MRVVGDKVQSPIYRKASGELLKEAANFNESMQGFFGTNTGIPCGVYHFRTHAEANEQQDDCLAKSMAELYMGRP